MTDVRVISEPTTYSPDNHETSYFADLYKFSRDRDIRAAARLEQGTRETLVLAEERGITLRNAEGRAMNSTTTSGGDFLPPLYFGDMFAEFKRARRVAAGLVWNRALPPNGLTVTVPRVSGGATEATQTDNTNLSNTDPTTATLTLPVVTVAGYVDVSRQLLERAVPGIDEVIAQDLLGAYGKNVDSLVINGTGTGGQIKGFLNVTGYNNIAYTSGTPTVGTLYPKLVDAVRQVNENVFQPASAIIMTARRWAWFLDALDSQNRPLVVPDADGIFFDLKHQLTSGTNGPFFNESSSIPPVGTLLGLPVYVDETLPKTQGVGTNQDVIITAEFKRHILWEDAVGPRMFSFEDFSGAQTASIRVACYGNLAFTAERFPNATSIITGTGLTAPTF